MRCFSLLIVLCLFSSMAFAQIQTERIQDIVRGKDATVGVAVLYGDEAFTVSNDDRYPLMSVFKFHIGITALKKMEKDGIALDSMVYIEPRQMREDTYSPLRERYPEQRIHISYREILRYTLSYSDNNTCDWLIDFVGGIGNVDNYVKSLGIEALGLTETESDMHADLMRCYNNWSTPLAVAELLEKIYAGGILTTEHFGFLEEAMLGCISGTDKLIAGLPAGIRFGHKTGHSDRTPDGVRICEADAGVIYLPNGEKCYLVVLIKDSRESDETNVKLMADIATVVYENCKSNYEGEN